MTTITFNRNGYDPFIDFLKGWAIICVVLTHAISHRVHDVTLFYLWGDWAVPIFLLIQVFHTYKKGQPSLNLPLWKMTKRIILPFIAITLLMFIIKCMSHRGDLLGAVEKLIRSGGIGPGCYYPWIYIQFFLLLPMLYKTLKVSNIIGGGEYLLAAIFAEIICSLVNMPQWFYRLFFIRYLFLIYLGYNWVAKGVVINKVTITLSIVSIVAIVFFQFVEIDLEPLFFNTDWKIFHWICFYYPATLLVYFLKVIYDKIVPNLRDFIKDCGKYSYEIFLWQMFVFTYLRFVIGKVSNLFDFTNILASAITFTFLTTVSIGIPLLYYKIRNKLKYNCYGKI